MNREELNGNSLSDPNAEIFYGNVRITPHSVDEVDGGRILVGIPRSTIQRITLCYGFQAERPIPQALFAGVIFLFGFWPFIRLAAGHVSLVEATMFGLFAFGAWGLWGAFRRGYYLLVDLDNDRRKLAFARKTPLPEILEFLNEARSRYEYVIDVAPEIEPLHEGIVEY